MNDPNLVNAKLSRGRSVSQREQRFADLQRIVGRDLPRQGEPSTDQSLPGDASVEAEP